MEIVVGREDNKSPRLCVVRDGKSQLYGQPDSVPMDVSRQHLKLQLDKEGKWIVQNLNMRNITFVNGLPVERKVVSETDKIELGKSHFLLPWEAVKVPKVEMVDIRPLKYIWDEYNTANVEIKKQQKNIGLLASIPMCISMIGGLFSGIAPEPLKPYAYGFTLVALIVMLYGFYKRFNDNNIEEQEELKKTFQKKYVCPRCAHFMGFHDYDVLSQADACPHCKAKFIK